MAPKLSTASTAPSVTIGGITAVVLFAGLPRQGINPDYAEIALPAATTFATLDEEALPLPKKSDYTKIVELQK
jgi:hypothetical protein